MMKCLVIVLFCLTQILPVCAQTDTTKASLTYGSKGWQLAYGKNYMMQLQWRFQFRAVGFENESSGPFVPEEDNLDASLHIQRARLKVGGHAYTPDLKYYLEYDFPSGYLLNWQFIYAKNKSFQFKLGQWKVEYSTERVVSSGKQQMVERSITNRYFTIDRQMGVMFLGTIFDGKFGCSSYYLGIFNGNGRGAENDDNKRMLMARYQWNFSKHEEKFTYSDLNRVQKPEGFLAVSAMNNQSAFTRFSSDGGGTLPGYEIGEKGQFDISQLEFELMLRFKGFSLMSENHIKKIHDLEVNEHAQLYGGYLMAGYFLCGLIDFFPEPMELTARYALVDHSDKFNEQLKEYSIGLNWFFTGHRNKLTMDYAYLQNQDFDSESDGYRLRVQWDISF